MLKKLLWLSVIITALSLLGCQSNATINTPSITDSNTVVVPSPSITDSNTIAVLSPSSSVIPSSVSNESPAPASGTGTESPPVLPAKTVSIEPAGTWSPDINLGYSQESIWENILVGLDPYGGDSIFFGNTDNQRIVVYDLNIRKEILSIDPPYGLIESPPSIHNNRIVFADVAMSKEEYMNRMASSAILPRPDYDIYLFDLQTNQIQQLTREKHAQICPVIYGDTVVWLDDRNTQPGRGGFDIYALDLKTNQETRLTAEPTAECFDSNQLAISENLVVWTDIRNVDKSLRWGGTNDPTYNVDIYAYDLNSKQEFRITTSLNNDMCPDVDKGQITWRRQVTRQKADIFLADFKSHRETLVSHDGYSRSDPSIHDGRIVWGNAVFETVPEHSSPLLACGTIMLYDFESRTESLLIPLDTSRRLSHPVIYGSYVVYRDKSKAMSPVFVAELSDTPSSPAPAASAPPVVRKVKPSVSYLPVTPGSGIIAGSNVPSESINLDG